MRHAILQHSTQTGIIIRGGADCIALLWDNDLYCKLKLKREEEKLTTKSKYLNKYSKR